MNQVKLVEFDNGKFGIKRGWLFCEYLSRNGNWFNSSDSVISFCMFDSAKRAKDCYDRVKPENFKIINEWRIT